MVDKWSFKNKSFPDCATEAFSIIKQNYNRVNKQELTHLANQYIFNNEYNQQDQTWIRKSNSMQSLQCVDAIVGYFESEKESNLRDFVFDVLFGDVYQLQNNQTLILLSSYAISLESKNTLECLSKWIILNIGNEITETIFNELVKDHFLLTFESPNDPNKPKSCLINLCNTCPLFSSLFITIVLDMQAKLNIHDKCLKKLFDLFEIWIGKNRLLPLLAYKSNLTHACSYLLNPLPSFFNVTIIYPLSSFLISFDSLLSNVKIKLIKLNKMNAILANSDIESVLKEQFKLFDQKQADLDDLSFRIHFVTLKLIKELANSLTQNEKYKLINLKHIEAIIKQIDEITMKFIEKSAINESITLHIKIGFKKMLDDCLDRLAQLLEICWRKDFATCTKYEIKQLYLKFIKSKQEENSSFFVDNNTNSMINQKSSSLLEIILNV